MPAPAQKPLGLDESRATTNEQARPLPYFAGKTRLGVTWISEAFNIKTVAVTQSAGKGKTTTTGYNYYASLIALVCHGPVDAIEKVYFNGDEVWSGDMSRTGGATFADLTLEDHGAMRIYWGTADQALPATDSPFDLQKTDLDHPPYRGQCYLIFHQIYFGFNQTNAPNVEVVLRRHPRPTWLPVEAVEVEGDCNPVAVVADLLQNQTYGLGWSADWLDTTALIAVAAQLKEEEIGISPYITKQTSARQLVTQICEYFDGYVLQTPEGKFRIGLIRPPAEVETLPLLDENVLLEEPELKPGSWRGVKSKTWVKFTDRNRAYKENALPYRDPGVALITTDNTPQTIERPWITRPKLAQMVVAASGRAAAVPLSEGELTVRKSAKLAPGTLFRLSYPQLGINELLMRVISCSTGRAGSRDISLQVAMDRSYLSEKYYVPEDDALIISEKIDPEPFKNQLMVELPKGLGNENKITVVPLAVRPNYYTTKFHIHLRRSSALAAAQPTKIYGIDNAGLAEALPHKELFLEGEGALVHFSYPRAPYFRSLTQSAQLLMHVNGEWMAVLNWRDLPLETDPEGTSTSGFARVHLIRGRLGTIIRDQWPAGFYFYRSSTSMFTLSYDLLGNHNGFALGGTVAEEYTDATDIIDNRYGLLITPDDVNDLPASPSLNNALNDDVLVFVGDEIISLAEVEYLDGGQCRLYGIRARYDTRRQVHAVGRKVFIIAERDLERLNHTSFARNAQCVFKLQPTAFGQQAELSLIPTTGITLRGRMDEPLAPVNLRAFDDGRNPVYGTTDDIPLTWSLTENGTRDFWARMADPGTDLPATQLDFYTMAGVWKDKELVPAGTDSFIYLKARREYWFATDDFKVRATALKNGLKSRYHDELTIRNI
ncbi:MAG TPA: hypothetical protein VGH19_02550 [Verrucomicrobiae bacterium]